MIISGFTDVLIWYTCTGVIAHQLTQSENLSKSNVVKENVSFHIIILFKLRTLSHI